jgi:hypothetical protein
MRSSFAEAPPMIRVDDRTVFDEPTMQSGSPPRSFPVSDGDVYEH